MEDAGHLGIRIPSMHHHHALDNKPTFHPHCLKPLPTSHPPTVFRSTPVRTTSSTHRRLLPYIFQVYISRCVTLPSWSPRPSVWSPPSKTARAFTRHVSPRALLRSCASAAPTAALVRTLLVSVTTVPLQPPAWPPSRAPSPSLPALLKSMLPPALWLSEETAVRMSSAAVAPSASAPLQAPSAHAAASTPSALQTASVVCSLHRDFLNLVRTSC